MRGRETLHSRSQDLFELHGDYFNTAAKRKGENGSLLVEQLEHLRSHTGVIPNATVFTSGRRDLSWHDPEV